MKISATMVSYGEEVFIKVMLVELLLTGFMPSEHSFTNMIDVWLNSDTDGFSYISQCEMNGHTIERLTDETKYTEEDLCNLIENEELPCLFFGCLKHDKLDKPEITKLPEEVPTNKH